MWKLRIFGFGLMVVGGYLFIYAVRDLADEWPQILLGLLSVFMIAMGFGILIMPGDNPPDPDTGHET